MKVCKTSFAWGTSPADKIVGVLDNDFLIKYSDWFDWDKKYYRLKLSERGDIFLEWDSSTVKIARLGEIKSPTEFKWLFYPKVFDLFLLSKREKLEKKISKFLTPKRILFIIEKRSTRLTRKQKQRLAKKLRS